MADRAPLPGGAGLGSKARHPPVRLDRFGEAPHGFGIIGANIEDVRDRLEIAVELPAAVSEVLDEDPLECPVQWVAGKDMEQRFDAVRRFAQCLAAVAAYLLGLIPASCKLFGWK
ncbi:MAG: hypothetical protein M9944_21865 [Rhizobiaceae bacterium]|nr:hypothetical protein [Rhizobiaceae bacterium]